MLRSVRAIEECDVALLLLDAHENVSKQDKRIADLVIESGKGLLVLVNKADLIEAEVKKEKLMEVRNQLMFARFAPVVFGSAKTRDGILKIFQHLQVIADNRKRRIAVKDLRQWYLHCIQDQPMKSLQTGKHITQAATLPPTFILFVRDPKKVTVAQIRFLENRLRETFGFEGTPVKFITKPKTKDEDE
jgi:GTP-binding protein